MVPETICYPVLDDLYSIVDYSLKLSIVNPSLRAADFAIWRRDNPEPAVGIASGNDEKRQFVR